MPDRQALCGILFVLHTGIQWEYLPRELGFGSGTTCWRRPATWNEAGVWDQLHVLLLKKLRSAKQVDWSLAVPVRSTAHHVLTDAQGIPLAVPLTGGNRNDVTQLLPLLDKIPPAAGVVGRPRHRPVIARRGEPHGSGLGVFRYVVERTIAWLHGFRLRVRWERRDDIHEAFLELAACLITYRHVRRFVRTS